MRAGLHVGEVLPDANVLVATARSFASYARRSDAAARAWKPNASDVLTALVVMVPTVEGYFGEWKSSRAITGSGTKEKAFVAHSRLVDVHDDDRVGSLTGEQRADRSTDRAGAVNDEPHEGDVPSAASMYAGFSPPPCTSTSAPLT